MLDLIIDYNVDCLKFLQFPTADKQGKTGHTLFSHIISPKEVNLLNQSEDHNIISMNIENKEQKLMTRHN